MSKDGLILAFGYKRMRGKNTAAEMASRYLKNLGKTVRMDAFAHSLKEMCRVVFGFSDEQLHGDLKGEVDQFWGFTPRWALQRAGTEALRKTICDDIWIKTLIRRVQLHEYILITDMRFPNEAKAIKYIGGHLIRCDRDMKYDPEMDTHISEIALDEFDDWDCILNNNGTREDLEFQVIRYIDSLL
jgi:hypothetical protein